MTVMDRTVSSTLWAIAGELPLDGVRMVWTGDQEVRFVKPGHDDVVMNWGHEGHGAVITRARGALKAEFLPHPQKTPFRPGRSRARLAMKLRGNSGLACWSVPG